MDKRSGTARGNMTTPRSGASINPQPNSTALTFAEILGAYDFDEFTAERTSTLPHDVVETLASLVQSADEIFSALRGGDLTSDEAVTAWQVERTKQGCVA